MGTKIIEIPIKSLGGVGFWTRKILKIQYNSEGSGKLQGRSVARSVSGAARASILLTPRVFRGAAFRMRVFAQWCEGFSAGAFQQEGFLEGFSAGAFQQEGFFEGFPAGLRRPFSARRVSTAQKCFFEGFYAPGGFFQGFDSPKMVF